jgi:hypothetical protein
MPCEPPTFGLQHVAAGAASLDLVSAMELYLGFKAGHDAVLYGGKLTSFGSVTVTDTSVFNAGAPVPFVTVKLSLVLCATKPVRLKCDGAEVVRVVVRGDRVVGVGGRWAEAGPRSPRRPSGPGLVWPSLAERATK